LSKLIDAASRRLLDRLRLMVKAQATAARQGGHRSPVLASGLEFADHRHYVPGDDVRRVDWKAFARHRQLSIRQFEEERDARVYVLCDLSSSMSRGEPPKLDLARRLAAAFSYVSAKQFDAVQVVPFSEDAGKPSLALRHRDQYPEIERFLLALEEGGKTSFPTAVRTLATRHVGRGLVVVVTDLMTPAGWSDSFRLLGALGHQLTVVRVTCTEDDKPDFRGEIELADAESGERIRLRMNKELLAAYRQVVREHVDSCRDAVIRVGGRFVEADVATPDEKILRAAIGETARAGLR
jgi:uncharacterized protein (DUF58 family)